MSMRIKTPLSFCGGKNSTDLKIDPFDDLDFADEVEMNTLVLQLSTLQEKIDNSTTATTLNAEELIEMQERLKLSINGIENQIASLQNQIENSSSSFATGGQERTLPFLSHHLNLLQDVFINTNWHELLIHALAYAIIPGACLGVVVGLLNFIKQGKTKPSSNETQFEEQKKEFEHGRDEQLSKREREREQYENQITHLKNTVRNLELRNENLELQKAIYKSCKQYKRGSSGKKFNFKNFRK